MVSGFLQLIKTNEIKKLLFSEIYLVPSYFKHLENNITNIYIFDRIM